MNVTMLVVAGKALLSLVISVQIASVIVRRIENKTNRTLPFWVLFVLIFVFESAFAITWL